MSTQTTQEERQPTPAELELLKMQNYQALAILADFARRGIPLIAGGTLPASTPKLRTDIDRFAITSEELFHRLANDNGQ